MRRIELSRKTYSVYNYSVLDHDCSNNDRLNSKFLKLIFNSKDVDYMVWCNEDIALADHNPDKNIGHLTESKLVDPISHTLLTDDIINNFKYIFTHDKESLKLHPKIQWVPAWSSMVSSPNIYKKTKLISWITSNNNSGGNRGERFVLIESLKDSLDLYGYGFNPIDNRQDGLADYMFSIAYENSSYSGYFTEKILDCFATGTIPIYHGDPDISLVFNMDGIILLEDFDIDSLSPELYYSKMDAIIENFNITQNNFLNIQDFFYKNYLDGRDE